MISPDWYAAHQRGFEHYKKARYNQAIEAFTEAIGVDPEAPRSYIARALCYRRLDQLDAARRDEQTAEELGGAERSLWDLVVNRSRRRWHFDFSDPAWIEADPISRKAVLLCMLNAQILNGGLFQWIANGYGQWIGDVIEAANDVDTKASREVAAMLEEVSLHLADMNAEPLWQVESTEDENDDLEDNDQDMGQLFACEDRYYSVQSQFVADVEAWLEFRLNTRWR
jgi:tetratricopeptide (TPR) repeat protein